MIGVIIAAGIGVDLWDAQQSRKLGTPPEELRTDEADAQWFRQENERLKTENTLLNMRNDALRKQLEELNQSPAGVPRIGSGQR